MKKVKLPTTSSIKVAKENFSTLEENLGIIMSQPLWHHRVPVEDKLTYLRAIAQARLNLWGVVEKIYPQCVGKLYTINLYFVELIEDKQDNKEKE